MSPYDLLRESGGVSTVLLALSGLLFLLYGFIFESE